MLRLSAPAFTDAALLARWAERREEAAFAELVGRHGPLVLGVCRRVLGDVQHAEDAFQATFLVLARKAATVRPETLPAFLFGVALRLAKKARGAARRRPMQPCPKSCEPADPHPHPLDALSGRELLALIDEEVARLPEVYRLPVLLCLLQERPVEEAARLLGWGVGSVRGRLARGKERLRDRLLRRGVCLSAGAVALLAQMTVPERLLAASLRNLAAPASAAVFALAAGPAPSLKWKTALLGLLLAAVTLGAGLPLLRTPDPEPPPVVAVVAQAKDEPRRDRYGDPLPKGAVVRLGTLRFRAPGEIDTLALSPDGKTVAVATNSGLFLLDTSSGKKIKSLAKSVFQMVRENRIAFSPDGKRLAARGLVAVGDKSKGLVRVWEVAGDQPPRDYEAEKAVRVGWSAEGEPLAVCLEAGALRLRELKSGKSLRLDCKDLIRPELYEYVVCAFTAEGRTLAAAEENRRVVHVWDTATGQKRHVLRPKGDTLYSLDVSPDGTKLVSCARNAVQLWDLAKGEAFYTVEAKDKYRSCRFSADGKLVALKRAWDTICYWDAATGREVGQTHEKYDFAESFTFSADGKTLATAERHSAAIHLFDVATGKQKPEPVGHRYRPHGVAFAPDGRRVATAGALDGTIHVWDLVTGESLVRIERPLRWVRDIALSPDGRSLYSTWTDENLWVCDAATGERRHVLKLDDPDRPDTRQSALSMHLSADGHTLVAFSSYYATKNNGVSYQDSLITGWDTATRKQLFRRRRPGTEIWNFLTDDARVMAAPHLATGEFAKEVVGAGPMRLVDVATGEPLLTFPALNGQTWPKGFSPDGRLLAVSQSEGQRNTLHLWETATAVEILALPVAYNYRPAFSPDGRLLALATLGQEILVWDLARGCELRRFKGFDSWVTWLAFSPDGGKLISGLEDSTLLVWDMGPRAAAPVGKLGAEGLSKAWADLAGADAPLAFRARWALASSPEEAIPLLKARLRRARPADPQRLRRLMDDLGSDQFAMRTKAQAGLEDLLDLAEAALRKALADNPTLEVRRRVEKVLESMRGPVTRPELLQSLRALAVLEDLATSAARQLLEELAAGAPEARLTREAVASLNRLDRRKPGRP
jgi:RNA polymerase sigma factor (sigma-70 family)